MSKEDAARQRAFLALLDEHSAAFERYAFAITGSSEDARDLVGESLLRAWQAFDTLRDPSSFRFFLITIAKRLHWRMKKRRALFLPFDRSHEGLQVDRTQSAETSADVDALNGAIAQLPPKMREALVLFELTGLSLKEIRDLQGGTLSGVKSRVARARKRLAQLLGVEDDSRRGTAEIAFPEQVRIEAEQ